MFKVRHSCQWRRLTWTFFIVLVLYSCKKPLKEEKFQGKPLFKINYKELDFEPTLCTNITIKKNDSLAYFFDPVKKLLVEYDISHSVFSKTGNNLKNDTLRIHLLEMVNPDSIWFNAGNRYLFLADMYHVKKVYPFKPLKEKYLIPYFFNSVKSITRQKFLTKLEVRCYDTMRVNYYEKYVNKANAFAFYKITQDSIILDKMIPLTNEQIFKQSDKIHNVTTYPIYFYYPSENAVFFTHKISDTFYKVTLDKDMNIQNIYKKKCSFGYPVFPIYYNVDTVTNKSAASAACAEKQNFIVKLYYDEAKKIIYKLIRYKTPEEEKEKEKTIVQVLDYNLNHIKNIAVPPEYYKWPVYINNTLIFCKVDKKKKIVYYEKMDNKIF
jgi:hypothetical protein